MAITVYPDLAANGYVSLQEAKDYWSSRLKVVTGKTDAELEAAIILATQYLDLRFRFVGYRELQGQALEWPRSYAYDDRGDRVIGVPQAVKHACCEYAFRALSKELMADPTRDDSGRVVKSKEEKVGPISESVDYSEFSGFALPVYPFADRMLYQRRLVRRSPGGIGVSDIERS